VVLALADEQLSGCGLGIHGWLGPERIHEIIAIPFRKIKNPSLSIYLYLVV
jgi:hypothetical protein